MSDERPGRLVVRDAVADDIAAVNSLANALIDTTTITWTDHHSTVGERMAWFEGQQQRGYPVLVAQDEAGDVIGYITFGDFRDIVKTPGYRFVVELTVHVSGDQWGQGTGRALMVELFERARSLGKTQMVAGVDAVNEASIRFHERFGFVEVARMPSVGFKHDRWLDLVLRQRAV